MKKNKKVKIIFAIVALVIVITCIVIQIIMNNANKELDKESEKLNTLIIKTKSGKKIETDYVHVEDNRFYIKIPKDFKQLDYETITLKYNGNVPNIVFSNEETTINVAISLTDNNMKNDQIKDYKKTIEKLFEGNSEIISTDYYEVDNHNVGSIKLITKAEDSDIYNNMIYFSYKDKLVIITFNCTTNLKDEWQNVGDFVIDSLFFME